jgi:hypothetical protein
MIARRLEALERQLRSRDMQALPLHVRVWRNAEPLTVLEERKAGRKATMADFYGKPRFVWHRLADESEDDFVARALAGAGPDGWLRAPWPFDPATGPPETHNPHRVVNA